MADHVGRAPDVEITINKSIPVAGGMAAAARGGGAGRDECAVGTRCSATRSLHAMAAELGSDVPFALHGGTALGTGRGEN